MKRYYLRFAFEEIHPNKRWFVSVRDARVPEPCFFRVVEVKCQYGKDSERLVPPAWGR